VRLAISSIAWTPAEETAAADLLVAQGVPGVELVPTRLGAGSPLDITPAQVSNVRAFWHSRGIEIAAMQALLFGRPELRIFDDASRPRTLEYLRAIIRLGGALGARALVFGAPKNRERGALPLAQAWPIAVEFFGALGEEARAAGTCLCIEPNPVQYGADFCTDSVQALALVQEVGSPGFGLHLDSACALLAGEDFPARIAASAPVLRHLHLSEPQLAPVAPGGTADIPAIAAALRAIDYQGFMSIEMKAALEGSNLGRVEQALQHVRQGS
jgi:D-psicose/D-tagatose/L-ribulose 3-epimerase